MTIPQGFIAVGNTHYANEVRVAVSEIAEYGKLNDHDSCYIDTKNGTRLIFHMNLEDMDRMIATAAGVAT